MKSILCAILMVCMWVSLSTAAAISEMKRDVTGYGMTAVEAITDGLVQAVGQLKGVTLSSSQIVSQVSIDSTIQSTEGWQEAFSSNASLRKLIRTRTRGQLAGYEIISVDEGVDGYQAELQVVYHSYQEQGFSADNRRSLAVVPFKSSRRSFMLLGDNTPARHVERELRNRMIDLFTHSRVLSVMDREFTEAFKAERDVWLSDDAHVGEAARLGNVRGVDYLVVGNIKSMQSTQQVETIQLTGERISTYSGVVQVDYKIIQAPTRQVKWSDTLRVQFSDRDIRTMLGKFGSSQTGMIQYVADEIVKEALGNIYPMKVVSVKGKTVVLNQGGDSLTKGQVLDVFFSGEEMFDPYTNESLGQLEEHVGKVKVVRITAKVTYTKFIEGDLDLVDVGSIVRPR
ncbi:MAG: hypothetical protein GY702_15950 [Desulfobulbaceae bacterium]|nr:hypothetical protein [Desulfobulbaceae bacterium]